MRLTVGKSLGAFLVFAALGFPALVVEARAETQPAGDASEGSEEIAPHEMTCEELMVALSSEELEEEASYLAVWAYGVRTGAKGLDFEKNPVTASGLESFVTRLVLACKADPDKLFVDAILE